MSLNARELLAAVRCVEVLAHAIYSFDCSCFMSSEHESQVIVYGAQDYTSSCWIGRRRSGTQAGQLELWLGGRERKAFL